MKIIAMGHRRYTGKDSSANFLATHLRSTKKNISVRKVGFASKLKEIAFSLYGHKGLKDEEYYEQNSQDKELIIPALNKSARVIWIELGNKIREIYTDTWLDYLFYGIQVDYLIIKDLRYINEAEAVLANGGFCIKIDNPNIEKHDDVADNALNFWDKWSAIITNDGTLKELNEKVISLANQLIL